MKLLSVLLSLSAVIALATPAYAQTQNDDANIEELDPFAPDVDQVLENFDRIYEEETGLSSHLTDESPTIMATRGCVRQNCPLFIYVNKSKASKPEDLIGKRIGSYSIGAAANYWMRGYLEDFGVPHRSCT